MGGWMDSSERSTRRKMKQEGWGAGWGRGTTVKGMERDESRKRGDGGGQRWRETQGYNEAKGGRE